jgi:hypothetical protein
VRALTRLAAIFVFLVCSVAATAYAEGDRDLYVSRLCEVAESGMVNFLDGPVSKTSDKGGYFISILDGSIKSNWLLSNIWRGYRRVLNIIFATASVGPRDADGNKILSAHTEVFNGYQGETPVPAHPVTFLESSTKNSEVCSGRMSPAVNVSNVGFYRLVGRKVSDCNGGRANPRALICDIFVSSNVGLTANWFVHLPHFFDLLSYRPTSPGDSNEGDGQNREGGIVYKFLTAIFSFFLLRLARASLCMVSIRAAKSADGR